MSVLTTKLRRDLGRSKGQFIAIAVTIFLGIMLFGGSYDAYRSLEASYNKLYSDLDFADLWITGGDTGAITSGVEATTGVDAVAVRHQADIGLRPSPDRPLFGRLVGLPLDAQPAVNGVMLLDGTYLGSPTDVLVDHHMSDHFDLKVGDTVEIIDTTGSWQPFTIRGIVASAEYLWPAPSRQQVFASPDDFGVVFAADDTVASIAGAAALPQVVVTYDGTVDAATLTTDLTALATASGASDTFTQLEQASNSALQEDVKGFGELAFMFPVLFLTAAGLGAWVMLTRLVMTQLPVIGTLMANGMSRRAIFRHYLGYGLVVGLAGAIPGVIAGALMAWAVAGLYTGAIDVPITVLKIDLSTPLQGLAFGIFAGMLSAALPAWRAIRLSPAEALRGARPTGAAQPTVLERVIPPLRRLSTERAMVLRNVFRNKRRTLTTMFGVVLALTLILVSWGMIDTVQILLNRQFRDVERSDAHVVLSVPADASLLASLEAIDGVQVAEATVAVPVSIEANGDRYGTTLRGYQWGTVMHGFLGPDGELSLPSDGLLLGDALRGLLNVDVGDTVTVHVQSLGLDVDQTVAGFVDEPLGTYAYASVERMTALVDSSPTNPELLAGSGIELGAALRLDPGTDVASIRDAIVAMPGVIAVVDAHALEKIVDNFMGLFYAFVGVMLAFGGMLAFGIIFNTMSVNLAERQVEVATMKAAGVTDRRIARLVTAENIIVTLVAIIPGLVIGFLLAKEFMAAYDSDQFAFTLAVRWTTFLFSALFILAVTLLSQRPGLKAIRRLDIARIVRERAV